MMLWTWLLACSGEDTVPDPIVPAPGPEHPSNVAFEDLDRLDGDGGLGDLLVGVGDATGDGRADTVFHSHTGLWLVKGPGAPGSLADAAAIANLPAASLAAGDLTGDGAADLAVGVASVCDTGCVPSDEPAPAAYVFGATGSAFAAQPWVVSDPHGTRWVYDGPLAYTVAVGDALAVGNPSYDGDTTGGGGVWRVPGPITGDVALGEPTWLGLPGDGLGRSLAAADTDGDGIAEIVASRRANTSSTLVVLSPGDTVAGPGATLLEAVGALSTADADGDGYTDVLVGLREGGAEQVLAVAHGPLVGEVFASSLQDRLVADATHAVANGAFVGDLDGDGIPEVAGSAAALKTDPGTAALYYGPFTGVHAYEAADTRFSGDVPGEQFPNLVPAGDGSGDGYDDFWIASAFHGGGTGAAWLVLGEDGA